MIDVASLPSVQELVAHHGLAAKKSLGQHFLFDAHWLQKIVRAAGNLRENPSGAEFFAGNLGSLTANVPLLGGVGRMLGGGVLNANI